MDTSEGNTLITALHTSGPAPAGAANSHLYSWLVGNWDMDVLTYKDDGSTGRTRGTIHAGWVLEGRAIQDVFAVPDMFYGTSLRFYDPHLDAWQVFWIDPLKQVFFRMIGRPRGADIINEGKETPELARAYGSSEGPDATVRWSFTEIKPDSFHWLSQRSTDGGATWRLQREYFARRVGAAFRGAP